MGDLVWDDRLISRAEALEMPAEWPVRPGIRQQLLFLDCGNCGQAVLPLGTSRAPFTTCPEQISQAVLRHMVSGHGMPLNHRREQGSDGDNSGGARGGNVECPAAAGGRGGPGGPGAGAVLGRQPAEIPGRHRKPETAGGDRA